MGERQGWFLEPTFQRAVKVAAGHDRLTSDGGALLLREADHRLGLVESLAAQLVDPRRQDRIRYMLLLAYNLTSLLRTELETSAGACWDLKRFQLLVLKAGGRLIKHSRRLVLTLARAVTPFWQTLAACLQRRRLPERWTPRGPQHRDWMPPPPHAHLTLVLRS